jgi:hypothetical protein
VLLMEAQIHTLHLGSRAVVAQHMVLGCCIGCFFMLHQEISHVSITNSDVSVDDLLILLQQN